MLDKIDFRHLLRLLSIGRMALGVVMIIAPGRAGRAWIGDPATAPGGRVALRALGARDLVIGYGTLHALDTGDPALRQWITGAGLCDLTDAAATAVSFRALPERGRVLSLALAGGAAVAAFVARDHLN